MKVVIIALVSIFATASVYASTYSSNAAKSFESLHSQIPDLAADTIIESTNSKPSSKEGYLYTGPDAGPSAIPTGEYLASVRGVIVSGPDYGPTTSERPAYLA